MFKKLGQIALAFVFAVLTPPAAQVWAEEIFVEVNPEISQQGVAFQEIFYTTNLEVVYSAGNVIFTPHPSYGPGSQSLVDDVIDLVITRPDTTTVTWTHDYSHGCTGLKPLDAQDLTNLFKPGVNKIAVKLYDLCGGTKRATSNVLTNLSLKTASPGPQPFLNLPWDYQGKGLSFTEAALAITSYFDHEHPLLTSTASEPQGSSNSIVSYHGLPREDKPYSSHDGYDYARLAKVLINNPVLAAGDGCASYEYSNGGGHTIKIDHQNGYQTRYLHLQPDGLFTKDWTACTPVTQGQPIGKVGASGRVIPAGEAGAHVHFSVVKDKNSDGNFSDNVPDGVVDPFGWQSPDPDPWENFAFSYSGDRTGSKSHYLWKKSLPSLSTDLTANKAIFELEKYQLSFPENSATTPAKLELKSSPLVTISQLVSGLGSSLEVTARDLQNNLLQHLENFFTLTVDFSGLNLTRFKPETLAIYSSPDGANWTKEPTTVDLSTATAKTEINHLSHFTLAGERIDTTAPTTTATFSATPGNPGWFLSDVTIHLIAIDNPSGLGVDYTLYQLDGSDWEQYQTPIFLSNEGHHRLNFYSVDNDDNIEPVQTSEFTIAKTPLEVTVQPSNPGLEIDADVPGVTVHKDSHRRTEAVYTFSSVSGQTLKLDIRGYDETKKDKLLIYSLQYNTDPPVTLPKNQFRVEYQEGTTPTIPTKQDLRVGDVKIRLEYDREKNETTVSTRLPGVKRTVSTLPGLKILRLVTNKGKLEYSY